MYLADTEIRARLGELDFGVPAGYAPFDEDAQIQPCSVDLRLGPRFWMARSRVSFDVRRHRLLELAPRRWWKEYNVAAGRSITLKPGGMLLGHVLERFQVPVGCAGRIQGRSSYARLGLMVHCAADFINPGWHGRFPLQLINLGRAPIKLYPGLPICQLLLVKVHGTVARPYGHAELGSLYVEDDGGPSFWWRDRLLRELFRQIQNHDVAQAVQAEIVAQIGVPSYEILDRLERFVAQRHGIELFSADELLADFTHAENRRRNLDDVLKQTLVAAAAILTTTALSIVFIRPITAWHYLTWALCPVVWTGALLMGMRRHGPYLGTEELLQIRQRNPRPVGDLDHSR